LILLAQEWASACYAEGNGKGGQTIVEDEPLFVLHIALRLLGDIRDDEAVRFDRRRQVASFLREHTQDRSAETLELCEERNP
jgi:hypothetical protein